METQNPYTRCKSSRAFGVLCTALTLGNGCANEPAPPPAAGTEGITLRVRFHGEPGDAPQLASIQPLLAPIERGDVDRILVDVTYTATALPVAIDFALTRSFDDAWEGTLPFLPRDEQLRFLAEAFDAESALIFSGETLVTLTIANQQVEIPLAPAQDQETFDLPRVVRIVYPSEIMAGQEAQIIFTIEGNAGETIDYAITSADGSTPFSPATGSVTLTNTVADFISLYTAPELDTAADRAHEVVITSADARSSVAVASNFTTHVIPRADGIDVVTSPRPSVRFNPVVLGVVANGTVIPDTIELLAEVSDDGDLAALDYQWSFTPGEGTPVASFANGGQGNPGLLQGYTGDVQGTITLAVTDASGGTTTLFYGILPEQFTHIIDHVAANGITQLVAGGAHTCVLTGEGKVRCWGDNQYGQLGYGNAQDVADVPRRLPYTAGDVPLLEPVRQLAAGTDHTCALLQSGLVQCWGRNDFGQLGYGTTEHVGDGEPVTSLGYVTLGGTATHVAAGGDHACALLESGALRCWGKNDFGQLGRGHTHPIGDDENVFVGGNVEIGADASSLYLGDHHTCALLTDGRVRCWGRNTHGQLGYGHVLDLGDNEGLAALPDVPLPGPARKLAAGALHTCALLENDALRCWGHGADGRTGYGFRPGSNPNYGDGAGETPLALPDVATGAPVTDVVAGGAHTCALLSSGALTCWGDGADGRLGYGDQADLGVPPASGVDLDGATAYRIAAGAAHTCALRSNGAARCWGNGGSGRLGHGLTTNVYSPAATYDILVFEPEPVTVARSCRDRLGRNPSAPDGVYLINPDGGGMSGAFQVYCDMSAGDGGWTLVATVANDGNHYWTWSNRARLYDGSTFGSLDTAHDQDFQSRAWHDLPGYQVLFKADDSDTKYLRYDSILTYRPLASRYPSGLAVVGNFLPSVVEGSWYYECGSLAMRLMSPDSDSNGWDSAAVGFVWQSVNNHSCSWDDTHGGINSAYPTARDLETWPAGEFYTSNLTGLNVFVR